MEAEVSCMACHDASPDWNLLTPSKLVYSVGPFGEGGMWVPIDATVGRSGAPANTPFVSHAIQGEVLCTRCHFAGNTYELVVLTAAGEPVPEPTATP